MDWQSIPNAGDVLCSSNLTEEPRVQQAQIFIRRVTEAFVQSCVKFHSKVGTLPFIYRERQIQSTLLPAIHSVADVVMVELPITRRGRDRDHRGRVDYAILHEDSAFLIELKFSWISATLRQLREETTLGWSKAWIQLNSIYVSEVRKYGYDPRKTLKIAMLIVPCYQASKVEKKLEPINRMQAIDMLGMFTKNLDPSPNFSCIWALDERLQTIHYYAGGRKEIYPYVAIVTRVENL